MEDKIRELREEKDIALAALDEYMRDNGDEQPNGTINLEADKYKEARRLYNAYDKARRVLALWENKQKEEDND